MQLNFIFILVTTRQGAMPPLLCSLPLFYSEICEWKPIHKPIIAFGVTSQKKILFLVQQFDPLKYFLVTGTVNIFALLFKSTFKKSKHPLYVFYRLEILVKSFGLPTPRIICDVNLKLYHLFKWIMRWLKLQNYGWTNYILLFYCCSNLFYFTSGKKDINLKGLEQSLAW